MQIYVTARNIRLYGMGYAANNWRPPLQGTVKLETLTSGKFDKSG